MIFYITIFIVSCLVLSWLGGKLIKNLSDLGRFLNWKEFIVAFFIMSFATSLPNFLIGVSSAIRGIPQLSFGDVLGGNMVDLTLIMALAVLFGKRNSLKTKSGTVQTSVIFTSLALVLPLLLVFDGVLSRGDGILLLTAFFIYASWLFSKGDNFKKEYQETKKRPAGSGFGNFVKLIFKIVFLLALLLFASQAVIMSAEKFSFALNIPLSLVGLLIIGIGNCLPEGYFAVISARKGENWMVLGNLMGSVIVCSTLVLGTVALIRPIEILDFSPFLIARVFAIITAFFFFFIVRSGKKITKQEALILVAVYIFFLLSEILRSYYLR